MRPWLRNRPVLQTLLHTAMWLGVVNFAVFMIMLFGLGGDAISGHEENGRYFLGNHGKLTEVSQAVFVYSKWHALSLWVTHPLAIAAILLSHKQRPGSPGDYPQY